MIKLSAAALWLGVYPTLVQLEAGMTSIDTDRDGTHGGHGILQGHLVTTGDVRVPGVRGAHVRGTETALLVLGEWNN